MKTVPPAIAGLEYTNAPPVEWRHRSEPSRASRAMTAPPTSPITIVSPLTPGPP